MNEIISAIGELTYIVIAILIFIVIIIFRKEISKRIADSKVKVKNGNTEVTIESDKAASEPTEVVESEINKDFNVKCEEDIIEETDNFSIEKDNGETYYQTVFDDFMNALGKKDINLIESVYQNINQNLISDIQKTKFDVIRLSLRSILGCGKSLADLVAMSNGGYEQEKHELILKALAFTYSRMEAKDNEINTRLRMVSEVESLNKKADSLVELIKVLCCDGKNIMAKDKALEFLSKYNKLLEDEQKIKILKELGQLFSGLGEKNNFLLSQCIVMNLSPNDADTLFKIGYGVEGEFNDMSLAAYTNALKIQPEEAATKNNIAVKYGEFNINGRRYQHLNDIQAKHGIYASNLALDYMKIGMYDQAQKVLETALKLDSQQENVLYQLGQLRQYKKDENEKLDKILKSGQQKIRSIQKVGLECLIQEEISDMKKKWVDIYGTEYTMTFENGRRKLLYSLNNKNCEIVFKDNKYITKAEFYSEVTLSHSSLKEMKHDAYGLCVYNNCEIEVSRFGRDNLIEEVYTLK